jgi:hypothetical protein
MVRLKPDTTYKQKVLELHELRRNRRARDARNGRVGQEADLCAGVNAAPIH